MTHGQALDSASSICSTWSRSSRTSSAAGPGPPSSPASSAGRWRPRRWSPRAAPSPTTAAPTRCTRTSCAPGDPGAPIVYTVDRIRDGRSFTTRRVVAVQHGQPIFHLSASFQTYEEGLEHQAAMPPRPGPGDAADGGGDAAAVRGPLRRPGDRRAAARGARGGRPALRRRAAVRQRSGEPREPRSQVWFRTNGKLRRRSAAARLPRHVRLRHDAARLGAARARPRRLGGRRRGRRLAGPRDVVPPPVPRRRVAAVRPGVAVGVRRPRPRPGPHLHPGRAAGHLGHPGGRGPRRAPLGDPTRRPRPSPAAASKYAISGS